MGTTGRACAPRRFTSSETPLALRLAARDTVARECDSWRRRGLASRAERSVWARPERIRQTWRSESSATRRL